MNMKSLALAISFIAINQGGLSTSWAQEKDLAFRLGAFAGAMNYCSDRHEDRQKRYRWAQLRATSEVSVLHSSDRLRALAARDRALERGQFFGSALDAQGCRRLLRAGEWQRFFKP